MSFVQISYFNQKYNLLSSLDSLLDLTREFRALAKISDSKVITTFVYLDSFSGKEEVILSDSDLKTVKSLSQNSNQSLSGIVQLNVLGNVPRLEQNNSSDAEIIESEIMEQSEMIKPVKQVTFAEEDEQIDSIPMENANKKKKKAEKMKKLVAKELEKRIPDIVEQTKLLVLQKFRESACPAAQRASNLSHSSTASSNSNVSHSQAASVVHNHVTCDGCQAHPIVGIRYKCVTCPDYDLCGKCEENGVHQHHAFLKIRKPELAPKVLVSVEADDEAQSLIENLPQESRHQFVDINFNTLLECFNSKRRPNSQPAEQSQRAQKKAQKKQAREQEALLKQQQEAELKQQQQEQVVQAASTEVKLTKAQIVASIIGGDPIQYVEVCEILHDLSTDDLIEYIIENNLSQKQSQPEPPKQSEPVVAAVVVQGKVEQSTPSEQPAPMKENSAQSRNECSSTPGGQEVDQKISSIEIKCKLIASILDDDENLFEKYLNLVKENSTKNIDDLLYTAMTNPVSVPAAQQSVVPPAVVQSSPVVVPVQEEKYPSALKKKAEQVAEIMGGQFTDYIDRILSLPCKFSVQQIIDNFLAENQQPQPQRSVEKVPEEKKVEQAPVQSIQNVIPPNKPQVLRKKYSLMIQKKAKEVADILGEDPQIYYGIVDSYCLSNVNELIEIILNNPNVTTQFSSYKD